MNNEELVKRLEEEKALVEELAGDKTQLKGQLEAAHRKNRDLVETHKKLTEQQRMLEHALSKSRVEDED